MKKGNFFFRNIKMKKKKNENVKRWFFPPEKEVYIYIYIYIYI